LFWSLVGFLGSMTLLTSSSQAPFEQERLPHSSAEVHFEQAGSLPSV
jgi:hypothetical protein